METYVATTPFGRRTMKLGQIASQVKARTAAKDAVVHKWQTFQHIREARDLVGATDRALAILNALLSFHQETALSIDSDIVVWPSNEQLMARANGMPPTTLRRHLGVLVECGLIIRRDSPNGKRYARKGRGGQIEQAFGFDLSPIVARAAEFKDMAEAVQTEKQAFRVAKERLTLLRRDIVKMIDTGIEERVPGNWGKVQQSYQAVISRLPRSAPRRLVESICEELEALWRDIREVLESFVDSQKMDANESHSGRHKQNSNPDLHTESEYSLRNEKEADGSVRKADNIRSLPKRELPLGIVLDACPGVLELMQGGEIRHWRDFLAAAELVRPMLGISPSAWREAQEALGEQHAAITLAAIYQRADQIGSPGGYLRSLTERAKEGKFSTWPMIMALLRAKLDAQKARHDTERQQSADSGEGGGLHVSEALLKSLKKPKGR
ncbi:MULTISPECIES: plasmid replication protein RepC [Ancylobacter]|uniref:Replication initiation protein RepC n=1 Tax=Ancylobacter polymorphus TaxID=223390 RepID=A0A9E7A012_9HYPH|nr:plasmid replication protein RepC [Ancylobacter polymorphus]UOK73486.1 replication initiation protein RepC [Ancylobacter polymorphus]